MTHASFLIKAVGSALTIAAGTLSGWALARKLEKELDELRRFELALLNLSTEVSYLLSSLPKALSNAGKRAGGDTGHLFSLIGSLSGMEQRRTVEEAFYLALEMSGDMALPDCELRILEALVKNLGIWGHNEQISFINVALTELRNERGFMHGEHRKKARMYRSLGILTGLGVAIVLL
ncbi:MAG TPA: hypothetical protein GX524_03850 [Firmicutes bacterium]|jgi:stage III sporulation protein AB|nr:hypothetical protein [Bacillota bacterium]